MRKNVPITGAHILLSSAGHSASQETTSDLSGHFRFTGVSPGQFTVMVTLQGFNTASASGDLQPGQSYQLTPFALTIATVNFTVNAVASTEELSLQEMHIEEQQRVLAIFPNFFVTYDWNASPLTPRQKFALAHKKRQRSRQSTPGRDRGRGAAGGRRLPRLLPGLERLWQTLRRRSRQPRLRHLHGWRGAAGALPSGPTLLLQGNRLHPLALFLRLLDSRHLPRRQRPPAARVRRRARRSLRRRHLQPVLRAPPIARAPRSPSKMACSASPAMP